MQNENSGLQHDSAESQKKEEKMQKLNVKKMWIGWFYVWICTFKTINQLPKVLMWNFYSSVFIQNTICVMGQVHFPSWQCTYSHSTCGKYQGPVSNHCYTGLSQVPINVLCSQTYVKGSEVRSHCDTEHSELRVLEGLLENLVNSFTVYGRDETCV